jgi:hypothetical protein
LWSVSSGGLAGLNSTANANMTIGVTIDQAGNDDEIMAFKSSDVAHGYTTPTEADTYGFLKKAAAADGGLLLAGFSEVTVAAGLAGYGTTDDTAKSSAAIGYVHIDAAKLSSGTYGAPGADANILVVRSHDGNVAVAKMIIDAEGDLHLDGTSTGTFDVHDDALAAADLARVLAGRGDETQGYNAEKLQSMRLVSLSTETDARPFVSQKRKDMLILGALGQIRETVMLTQQSVQDLKARVTALEKPVIEGDGR